MSKNPCASSTWISTGCSMVYLINGEFPAKTLYLDQGDDVEVRRMLLVAYSIALIPDR